MQIFKTMKKSEILCVDKALLSDGKNTVQAKQWLDKCYLDSALSETTVKRWYADFKHNCTDTNDLNTQVPQIWQLSWKTPKDSTNSFCLIVN